MSKMKQYCLSFKPLSSISRIPDAQTIFGAICNIINQTQGEEAFNKYIQSFETQPMLLHSSMFPENLLPMIQQSIFSTRYINQHLLQEKSEEQLAYLQKMKQYKKIVYMSQNVYQKYIASSRVDKLQKDLLDGKLVVEQNCLQLSNEEISHQLHTQLGTHVKKSGYYLTEDNELYYDKQIYVDHNTQFCIYVKTTLAKPELVEIFKYVKYFGLGPRHSVGKNSFELMDITETNHQSDTSMKLLLSKSMVDEDYDLSLSHYAISSKLHRTSKYYLDNQLTGRLNFLNEGSYVHVSKDKEWYGKVIKQRIQEKNIFYYAIGFVF